MKDFVRYLVSTYELDLTWILWLFLKQKRKRNSIAICFSFDYVKNSFSLLWGPKRKFKKVHFQFFLFAIVLWSTVKGIYFQHKLFIFKVSVIFLKWKFFRACTTCARGKICRFLGIELIKIFWSASMCLFLKIAKEWQSLHSTVIYYSTVHYENLVWIKILS